MTQRYQIIVHQAYNSVSGDAINNVFWYENIGIAHDAVYAAELFSDTVLSDQVAIMSAAVKFVALQCVNLDDPLDYTYVSPMDPSAGNRSGDCLPPFVAWAFRLNRASRASRNGQKRIGGVAEPDQVNGVPVEGIVTLLNAFATTLATNLNGTGGEVYAPRICRRPAPGAPLSASVFFPIQSATFTRISSQNSRKFGRGI